MQNNYKADMHCHSSNSHDAFYTAEDMCKAALSAGVNEIAFTDHYDCVDSLLQKPNYIYEKYINDINKARDAFEGRLTVISGVEIGDVHLHTTAAKQAIEDADYDYVLLSVHTIGLSGLWVYDFDTYDVNSAIEQYFSSLCYAASTFEHYDCLAHIDLPRRYLAKQGIVYHQNKMEEYMRELLKLVISKGKGIEINTSGLRDTLNDTMPSQPYISIYKEYGGRILTFGSDSHTPNTIYLGIQNSLEMASDLGFDYFSTYTNRQCNFHKIY